MISPNAKRRISNGCQLAGTWLVRGRARGEICHTAEHNAGTGATNIASLFADVATAMVAWHTI